MKDKKMMLPLNNEELKALKHKDFEGSSERLIRLYYKKVVCDDRTNYERYINLKKYESWNRLREILGYSNLDDELDIYSLNSKKKSAIMNDPLFFYVQFSHNKEETFNFDFNERIKKMFEIFNEENSNDIK